MTAPPRSASIDLSPDEFRTLGHRLVDRLADFLRDLPARRVGPDASASALRALLGTGGLPERGTDPARLLDDTAAMLVEHSLFNGHPGFMAYITAPAAPLGSLADFLAATINQNCGSWSLSPMATLVEEQTVRWLASLVGLPAESGGIIVSGGNMANLVAFWAARAAKAPAVRERGAAGLDAPLVAYCSAETHTWIQKAADLSGLGTQAVRWIPVDAGLRMDVAALESAIDDDRREGRRPFLVVGAAGTVSTGAVDPLPAIAEVCRTHDLWFHVDGAYGAPAVLAEDVPADLAGIAEADSVAVDPHKWLYAPLEAGCALVRRPETLGAAFSYTPAYYHFDSGEAEPPPNYYERGPQNSRGFKALKVWMALRQIGREGYAASIAEDIRLARRLFELVESHQELEAVTYGLSIATFRYVPPGVDRRDARHLERLNALNESILDRLQRGGRAYVSNAVVSGKFLLRACIVNFRTSEEDLHALVDHVVELGRQSSIVNPQS